MSIYRPKGSPFFHYDFRFKGCRHHGSTGCADRQDAKAIEAAHRAAAARAAAFGQPKKRPVMTVDEAFGRYWHEKSQHTAGSSGDEARFAMMARILGPTLPFQDMDDDRISLLVAKLRARTVGKEEKRLVANATVNKDIEGLRRVWKRAAKLWRIEHGDEPDWSAHLLPVADERVRELTGEEETRLFAALRQDYHPIVRFAILSGIRVGNLRALKWADVDFSARVVTMRIKSRQPGGRHHVVPITAAMLVLLANERGKHPVFVFAYRCTRSRGCRAKDTWQPFTRDGWRREWIRARAAAGIEDFRFHDLRHTAATRTLRASGNLRAVQKMLGHTKITTTTRYAHAMTEDIRVAMEAAQSRNSPEADSTQPDKDNENQATKARA